MEIPQDQWNLPVGFTQDGKLLTLRDAASQATAMLTFAQLDDARRAEIVARRIEMQPKFNVGMLGVGVLDRARAVAEVRAWSGVGRILIEIEQRVIQSVLEAVRRS